VEHSRNQQDVAIDLTEQQNNTDNAVRRAAPKGSHRRDSKKSSRSWSCRRGRRKPSCSRSRSRQYRRENKRRPRRAKSESKGADVGKAKEREASVDGKEHHNYDAPKQLPEPDVQKPLLPFKVFLERHTRHDIAPKDAIALYKDYERKCRLFQATQFFMLHREDGIVRDRFHPTCQAQEFVERTLCAQRNAYDFIGEMGKGLFEQLCLTATNPVATTGGAEHQHNLSCETCEIFGHGEPPHFSFDPDVCTLVMKDVPAAVSRWDLHRVVSNWPGCMGVWLPALTSMTSLSRDGYARFISRDDLAHSIQRINRQTVVGFNLKGIQVVPRSHHQVRVAPSVTSDPARLEKDAVLTAELIEKMDAATGVPQAQTTAILAHGSDVTHKLDLRLLYLRRVHHISYYEGIMCKDERELASRSGVAFLRAPWTGAPSALVDSEASKAWITGLDERVQKLLASASLKRPEPCMPIDEEPLKSLWLAECEASTNKLAEGRFKCVHCPKQFKAPEFLHKHLTRVHPHLLDNCKVKVQDECMKLAFISSPVVLQMVDLPRAEGSFLNVATPQASKRRRRH